MAKKANSRHTFSRREMLRQVGILGATAGVPVKMMAQTTTTAVPAETLAQTAAPLREPLETLTAAEANILEAIAARLIPTDENGPGATEARAAHYIDRALGGALASSREAYRTGLAAVDTYAQASKGAPFAKLSTKDQDAVLSDMEKSIATGFTPNSSSFFNLIRAHTIQGTFCDPYYGGNANFVGWDLIEYPGLRLAVTADEQRLEAKPKPTRKSAYDHAMFSKKKPARARVERSHKHYGD